MSVYDSRGMKNQQYGRIIREGMVIVKRRIGPGSIKSQLEKPENTKTQSHLSSVV